MDISELRSLSSSLAKSGVLDEANSALAAYRREMFAFNQAMQPNVTSMLESINSYRPHISSALDLLRQQHEGSINSALRAAAGISSYSDSIAKAIGMSPTYKSLIEEITAANSLISDYQKILKSNPSVYDAALGQFKIDSALREAIAGFGSLLREQANQAADSVSANEVLSIDDEPDDALDKALSFVGYLKAQLTGFRQKHPAAQTIFIIYVLVFHILPLLFNIYQLYDDDTSKEVRQLRAVIESTFKEIQKDILRLEGELQAHTIYRARRFSPITSVKKYTGEQVGCVNSGDWVEVLEFQGRWVYVSVYNSDEECQGWVLKKYLRRANPADTNLSSQVVEL